MASFEPQDFGFDEPPPRPTTPPIRKGFLLVLFFLSVATLLVYGVPYVAERTGYAWESGRSRAATEALAKLDAAGVVNRASLLFRMATVAVSPAVVNIQTQKFRKDAEVPGLPIGGGANRFGRGIESFSVGSGVIIDKEHAYIVTNNHVVNEADVITVRLSQGAEVPARLVGADPKTDLAVLQIAGPVKVGAEWGDSDKLSSGDWVLAIGSPYMLDHTVTKGIVSATGRNNLSLPGMDENAYQDFIQTDAPINPGNSGGPLIDLNGKVIGINTAILTGNSFMRGDDGVRQSGGFEGIGLAIPSSMARKIVEKLIRDGKVVRGYLGIMPQPVTPAFAKAFNLKEPRGAVVGHVQPGSPAEQAGLKVGDLIVKIQDKEILDPSGLRNRIAELDPGTEVAIEYVREGKQTPVKVVVGDLSQLGSPYLNAIGLRFRELPASADGKTPPQLEIDQVVRGSIAFNARMVPGLRVKAIGQTAVGTIAEFDQVISKKNLRDGIPLQVETPDGKQFTITIGGQQR